MDIEQEFEKFVEEDEAYGGTKKWKKGQNKMKKAGITLQKKDKFSGYVEEDEKEARTYLNKKDDDEDKKKRHFAFGGKKKEKHGKSGYRKGEEVEKRWTGGKLPPHLAKFFDKDGNLKKDAAARVAKGREKINWKDVTPKGYGPKEEVKKQTNIKEKIMDLKDTIKQVIIGETNKKDKSEKVEIEEIELSKEDAASFISAASKAKQDGKKKFKIGGKEYPVTIKVKIPEEKVELKKMNKEKVEKKESKSFSKMFSHIKSLMQGK